MANVVTYVTSLHRIIVCSLAPVVANMYMYPQLSPAKVFQVRFWMMHHGAPTPKPTIFMGNLPLS